MVQNLRLHSQASVAIGIFLTSHAPRSSSASIEETAEDRRRRRSDAAAEISLAPAFFGKARCASNRAPTTCTRIAIRRPVAGIAKCLRTRRAADRSVMRLRPSRQIPTVTCNTHSNDGKSGASVAMTTIQFDRTKSVREGFQYPPLQSRWVERRRRALAGSGGIVYVVSDSGRPREEIPRHVLHSATQAGDAPRPAGR